MPSSTSSPQAGGRGVTRSTAPSHARLAQPRLASLPVIGLEVPKNELVPLKLMHNAIHPAITLDMIDARVLPRSSLIFATLGFEQRDAETARLEDAHDLLHNVDRVSPIGARGHVGLEA